MDVRRLALVPVLAALAAAAALAAPQPDPTPPPAPAPAPRPVAAAPKGPNQLFFCLGDHLYRCDPDGRNGRIVPHPPGDAPHPDGCSLSPDGTKVLSARNAANDGPAGGQLLVFAADGTGPVTDLSDGRSILDARWAGDGARLYVKTAVAGAKTPEAADYRDEVVDIATRRRTRLALPPDHFVTDWSRDGARFLTCQFVQAANGMTERLRTWILNRDGTPVREVLAPAGMQAGGGTFSPDGRRVLLSAHRGPDPDGPGEMFVLDLATGAFARVAGVAPGGRVYHACWSPDGRRLAYTWHQDRVEPKPGVFDVNQKIELRVVVCDPDGRNAVVAVTERTTAGRWSVGAIDWR